MSAQITVSVELEGREPYEVETRLIDHNLWDVTRAKHKWPQMNEAPVTWLGFLGWAASRRTGKIEPTLTWETFLAACLNVETVDDDEEVGAVVPMSAAPGLDSFAS